MDTANPNRRRGWRPHKKRLWPREAPPHALVVSGAGLSAESGLSTFRAANGLWAGHDIDRVCRADTWRSHRAEVFDFYNARRQELAAVAPNTAHRALAELARSVPTVMLTQNADDLLERAGCPDVRHLHGRLSEMACTACGHGWDVGHAAVEADTVRCPACGSHRGVRPGVVFFGDPAPMYTDLRKAVTALRPCDGLLVVGTSGAVVDIYAMADAVACAKHVCDPDPPALSTEGPGAWTLHTDAASRGVPAATAALAAHLAQAR